MSASVVAQVVDAVAQTLARAPAVSTLIERRSRARAIPDTAATAVTVGPFSASADDSNLAFAGADVWSVRVAVECYARAVGDVDSALDALVQAAFSRLMTDPTLGGAVPGGLMPPSITYDFDALDARYASATLFFTARVVSGPSFT